jgi:hypothetical protein
VFFNGPAGRDNSFIAADRWIIRWFGDHKEAHEIMRCVSLVNVCLVVTIAGCGAPAVSQLQPARPAILSGNDADIRDRLLAKIPVGTTVENAEQVVKGYGLRCSKQIDDKTQAAYLSCGYTEQSSMWVKWVWHIRIDCPDGVVSEIQCKQGGIGP